MSDGSIALIATGGTIEKVYNRVLERNGFDDKEVVRGLLDAAFCRQVTVHRLCKKDSNELTDEDRAALLALLAELPQRRVLITHGTSRLTDTGRFLDAAGAAGTDRTIVLTGSLYPAEMMKPESGINLGYALAATQMMPPGVYVAMHGMTRCPTGIHKNLDTGIFEDA